MKFILLTSLGGAEVLIRAESVAFFKAERDEPITSMIYFNDRNMLPLSVRETIEEICRLISPLESFRNKNEDIIPPSVFDKELKDYMPKIDRS